MTDTEKGRQLAERLFASGKVPNLRRPARVPGVRGGGGRRGMSRDYPLASKALAEVCHRLAVSPEIVFAREAGTRGNTFRRAEYLVKARHMVWSEMRSGKWKGVRFTYPEIAAVSGCAHSTVFSALRKYRAASQSLHSGRGDAGTGARC